LTQGKITVPRQMASGGNVPMLTHKTDAGPITKTGYLDFLLERMEYPS
jgi:hypothetical protein